MSHDDELRTRVNRLAHSHRPAELRLDAVTSRGDRRGSRQRLTAVAGVFMLVLATVGVVRLINNDASDVDIASDADVAEEAGDAEPVEELPTTTTVPATTTSGPVTASESASDSAFYGGGEWVVPWGDGFLSLGQVFVPSDVTMLDLVPDIAERFSPEIIAALDEGGVTGIPESTEVLRNAGLLDLATEEVNNDPVLLEAYTQVNQGGTYRFEASISSDGVNWDVLPDFALPGGSQNFNSVQSDGKHLVVAEQIWDSDDGTTSQIEVSSTTDLVSWTTAALPIVRPSVPDYVHADVYLNTVAIGPGGWYATTASSSWIDIWALIPEDLRTELEETGYGWTPSPDGLVIESYDYEDYETLATVTTTTVGPAGEDQTDDGAADGELRVEEPPEPPQPAEVRTIPWSELGLTYDEYTRYNENFDGESTQAWVGNWSGAVGAATPPIATSCCEVIGTDSGFIAQSWGDFDAHPEGPPGPKMFFSTDGQTWDELSLPGDGWVGGISSVRGGVLMTSSSDDGTQQVWRGSPAGEGWEAVEIPGLPVGANVWFGDTGSRGIASIIDTATYDYAEEQVEYMATFETDGFEIYFFNHADGSVDFRVTDLASGDIVAEHLGVSADGEEPEFISTNEDGFSVLDENGDVILTLDSTDFSDALLDSEQAAREASGYVEPDYDYTPDYWLVASLDGLDWHVEDLADLDGGHYYGQSAINGTTVLMRGEGGWITYDIG